MIKVSEINIYPIKSCGGYSVFAANLTTTGFEHDRQFVLIDSEGRFLSQRTVPKMCLIKTALGNQSLVANSPDGYCRIPFQGNDGERREVDIWGGVGTGIDMGDEIAGWFSDCLGVSCRLLRQTACEPRKRRSSVLAQELELSFADGYPVLIISEASLANLNSRLDEPVPMNRFRPNIVIKGCAPFDEDNWGRVEIGPAQLQGAKPCERCAVPMVDQATGVRGKEPIATLAKYRRLSSSPGAKATALVFGKNFIVPVSGRVRVGDEVNVVSA